MLHKLRIGIRNNSSDRGKLIKELFNIVKNIIKDKTEFNYDIKIEDYSILKRELDKGVFDNFKKTNLKAIVEWEKKIIVFNDSFFDITRINQKSVFIHELGHIEKQPPKEADINNPFVKNIYGEYLADYYLFSISKDIFLNGRVIPDLDIISIDNIKEEIKESQNNENVIKGNFFVIGRLYYYNSLYPYNPILLKINELINLIKQYYPSIDFILKNLKELCENLKSKSYEELMGLFNSIDSDVITLNRNQFNQP